MILPEDIRTAPKQARSLHRIALFLDTAALLIDELGLERVTTTEIAGRSGSSVGALYRYFPHVESIFTALAERNRERYTAALRRRITDAPADWLELMDAAFDSFTELARTEPGFAALRLGDQLAETAGTWTTGLAASLCELVQIHYEVEDDSTLCFDIDVAVRAGASVALQAFAVDPAGEARYLAAARAVSRQLLSHYVVRLREHSPVLGVAII